MTKTGGIYIHVPFCQKRCIYCDFYSTTYALEWKRSYVSALKREMLMRHAEIDSSRVPSLYIGGGTPSQLPSALLLEVFRSITETFTFADDAEITIEVNPDDVTTDLIAALRQTSVNRISMGVQTFSDDRCNILFHIILRLMAISKWPWIIDRYHIGMNTYLMICISSSLAITVSLIVLETTIMETMIRKIIRMTADNRYVLCVSY